MDTNTLLKMENKFFECGWITTCPYTKTERKINMLRIKNTWPNTCYSKGREKGGTIVNRDIIGLASIIVALLILSTCGGASNTPSTDDTDADTQSGIDIPTLSTLAYTSASALIPTFSSIGSSSSISKTYVSDDIWNDLKGSSVLSDIFSSPDDGFDTVTKLRVMIESFSSLIEQNIGSGDDSVFSCEGKTKLADGQTIAIDFFDIAADKSEFQCLTENEAGTEDGAGCGTSHDFTIFGKDINGIIRLVWMSDNCEENKTQNSGAYATNKSVLYATFKEEDGAELNFFLDLQYAQATIYWNENPTDATNNNLFKSRSRVTGSVTLSGSTPTDSLGQFSVTKYDMDGIDGQNPHNSDGEDIAGVTKVTGRGRPYESGDDAAYSIFSANTTWTGFDYVSQNTIYRFCLETSNTDEHSIPGLASDSGHCAQFENSLPWDVEVYKKTFPFSLSPALAAEYSEDELFFEEEDLIASDGSNFEIPSL